MSAFDVAFEAVIGHEGGYVNDKNDPGGETKFGISKRSYPSVDIANLTVDQAKEIYRRDFWDAVKGDEFDPVVGFNLFDAAVNSGRGQAVRWLQRAAGPGIADDGILGPITIAAAKRMDPGVLAARMLGHRLTFMTNLSTWPSFGKGWSRRIANNLMGFPA